MHRFDQLWRQLTPRQRRQMQLTGAVLVGFLLVALIAGVAFQLGQSIGLARAQEAAATAEAMRSALGLSLAPTPSATATETLEPTFTPTRTPTPTATPASPREWAERYFNLAMQGLTTLAALDFTPERAGALVERLAHGSARRRGATRRGQCPIQRLQTQPPLEPPPTQRRQIRLPRAG